MGLRSPRPRARPLRRRAPSDGWSSCALLPSRSVFDAPHGAHEAGLDCQFLAHHGPCLELVDAGAGALKLDPERQLIPRLHRSLESCAVDADEVVNRIIVDLGVGT